MFYSLLWEGIVKLLKLQYNKVNTVSTVETILNRGVYAKLYY